MAMRRYCLGMAVVFVVAQSAWATFIDFEAYTDRQNLDGMNLGGVTLSSPGHSVVVYRDNNITQTLYHSPFNAIANFKDLETWRQDNPLTGVFDVPVNYVSLWAGDRGGHVEQWRLDAYDAVEGGNLVGSKTSIVWSGNPYQQLSISGGSIWRIEVFSVEPPGIGIAFDDLEFMPIPAPGAILLGTIGTGLVGWMRRRRTV